MKTMKYFYMVLIGLAYFKHVILQWRQCSECVCSRNGINPGKRITKRLLRLAVVLTGFLSAQSVIACTINFTSPPPGSTHTNPTITLTGVTADIGDPGIATATLNGQTFYNRLDTFKTLLDSLSTVPVTLIEGANDLVVNGFVSGMSCSDQMVLYYDPPPPPVTCTINFTSPPPGSIHTDPAITLTGVTSNLNDVGAATAVINGQVFYQRSGSFKTLLDDLPTSPVTLAEGANNLAVSGFVSGASCSDQMVLHYDPLDPPGPTDPPEEFEEINDPCDGVGNPCNVSTGDKYQTEADFIGQSGVPSFTRTYHSQVADMDAGLGYGWSGLTQQKLTVSGDMLLAHRRSGYREAFERVGSVWQGNADSDLSVAEDAAGFTITFPNGKLETYNLQGILTSIREANGQITTYQSSGGQTTRISGPFGHMLDFIYDGQDRLITMTDPEGNVFDYVYDGNGNLSTVTYPDTTLGDATDNPITRYHYENSGFPHHLTGITDENGDRFSTYAYDAEGRAISTEHADLGSGTGQEQFQIHYTDDATTTQPYTRTVTDAVGNQESREYEDVLGVAKLLSETNLVDGKTESSTYDANGNRLSMTDAEGRVTRYTYNATNQRVSMSEADGSAVSRITTYEYISADIDIVNKTVSPSVSSGLSKEIIITHDSQHNPLSVTINGFRLDGTAVSRAISYQYNSLGQVTEIDGPRTDVSDLITFAYNDCNAGGSCGQLASLTNALGHTTTFDSYDGNGRLLQSTDPNAVVSSYTYHPRGWVLSMTQTPPAGSAELPRTTQYTYDNVGQLVQMTTPDGIIITNIYDAAHYLRSVEDNLGNRMTYQYDLKGNRTQTETYDPDGTLARTLETAYDHRNFMTSLNAAGSLTQLLKDAVGNTTSQTDPNQNPSTTTHYDPLDRITQMVDAIGGQTDYAFNVQDQLVQVTSPNGASTQYAYDDLGNLLSETSPDRGQITYQHDAAGNVIQMTDARGVIVSYTYDVLNRLLTVDYSGTTDDITYLYDTCTYGIGRSCQVSDQSGVTEYQYDPWGNLTEQNKTELGSAYLTTYQYDVGDRIISITYPDSRAITYTRDILGRVESIAVTVNGVTQSVITDRDYEADHQLQKQTYGHGVIEDRSYDLAGQNHPTTDLYQCHRPSRQQTTKPDLCV